MSNLHLRIRTLSPGVHRAGDRRPRQWAKLTGRTGPPTTTTVIPMEGSPSTPSAGDVPIDGRCDPRFDVLTDLLAGSVAAGDDLGASVAVFLGDELVVDLWAGWSDPQRRHPWSSDTITNTWSTTKTMTNLTALVATERGLLDLDAPVIDLWPEFGRNGTDPWGRRVLVRHLLGHTSGVAGWRRPVGLDTVLDHERSIAHLADQRPWWEPGTASGYHALVQGHLVGELIARATGRSLGQYFAEEIADPLGADFHIGLGPEHDHRISFVLPPELREAEADDDAPAAWLSEMGPDIDATVAHLPEWRRAEIGAANGHGNARSVALVQSVVANGGITRSATGDHVRLLSPATIERIFDEQAYGHDLVLGEVHRFGIGYGLPSPQATPHLPDGRIAHWGGWGGSAVVVDTDRQLTLAYVMNRMVSGEAGDDRADALIRATYALLEE